MHTYKRLISGEIFLTRTFTYALGALSEYAAPRRRVTMDPTVTYNRQSSFTRALLK
jgi:hypothetical protein